MTIDWLEATLKLEVTDNQRLAAAFLESQGLRLCIDYGLLNCEQKSAELIERLQDY